MFIPCKLVNGVWVVLEEPKGWKNWQDVYIANNTDGKTKDRYTSQLASSSKCTEYQYAKHRVLFEGIEYVEAKHESSYSIVRICKSLSTINYPSFWKGVTVEKLIPYNLTLTDSTKLQIGI
jgi:hypothetical protein